MQSKWIVQGDWIRWVDHRFIMQCSMVYLSRVGRVDVTVYSVRLGVVP